MPSSSDLAIAADGSFVETTNQKAAEALAAHYSREGEGKEQYAVQSRVENGRTIYRIRPRSVPQPSSPTAPSAPNHSSTSPPSSAGSSAGQMPFAKTSTQPPPPTPPKPQNQPSIAVLRSSRSIALLDAEGPSSPLADGSTYLAPTPASYSHTGSIRRAGSTPSLSAVASSSSVSLSRSKSTGAGSGAGNVQGDVLGRLLGWNAAPMGSSRREEGTAQLGLPGASTGEEGATLAKGSKGSAEERDSSDLPQDPVVDELISSRPRSDSPSLVRPTPSRTNSSPFGAGVRVPAPPRSRDPSADASTTSLTGHALEASEPRTMREVASSDSIRTAKADDHRTTVFPSTPQKSRWDDPTVFDVIQGFSATPTPTSPTPESPSPDFAPHGREQHHERLPSSASFSSSHSQSSSAFSHSSSAHHITVSATTAPGDDPRFVIWGLRDRPATPSPNGSAAGERRGSIVDGELGSPGTSASGSPATASSKRWSGFRERRDTGESYSPASSVRDSIGSARGIHPQQQSPSAPPQNRVLMAATAERWIAELTSQISSDLLSTFFLTYRAFLNPFHLLHLLIARFDWALQPPSSPSDEASRRIVRVRTFVVIRHWLLNHFMDDFFPHREVRKELTEWLNRCGRDERFKESQKDMRLIKGLKKICRRLKEMHVVLGPGDAREAKRVMEEVEQVPKNTALGASDEDVDLELDLSDPTGSAPLSTPPSASPARDRGRLASFLHHKSPPDLAATSAAAQSPAAPAYLPSSIVPASTAAQFPLPTPTGTQNHPLARSLHNALGSLGRFKRMLGNRTGATGVGAGGAAAGSTEMMDEVEFEKSETGDLLWVKGGVDRYLEFWGIAKEGEGQEEDKDGQLPALDEHDVGAESTPSTSIDTPREASYVHTIAEEKEPDSPRVAAVPDEAGLGLGLPSTQSKSLPRSPATSDFTSGVLPPRDPPAPPAVPAPIIPIFEPSSYDLLDDPQHPELGSRAFHLPPRPSSTRIELDDIDLSDEDEDVVEVKRTLKRLPGAGNLRTASNVKGITYPPYRHSMESVSSYGSPRPPSFGGAERESILPPEASFVDDEEGVEPAAGVQIVAGFILEGIDDSDDEDDGGGIEAALRRLEGIVDDTREKKRKRKVERQMERSAMVLQLQQAGVAIPPSLGGQQEQQLDQDDRQVVATPNVDSIPPVEVPFAEQPPAAREAAVVPAFSLIQPSSPPAPAITTIPATASSHRPASKLPPLSLSRRAGPGRKPSLSKLFGGGSAALRPTSSRLPLPGMQPTAGPTPPTHRSFLLLYRTESLARQFCLIERDMLRVLGWQELVSGAWRRDRGQRDGGEVLDWEQYLKERRKVELKARERGERMESAVQAVIARFNLTANWVCSEIILTANPEERVALIAKFIRLAFKCYCQSNFQTLTQIIHGLQLPDVERLTKTWARVPTWEMRKFRGMQVFVSHLKSFKHLREVTNALIAEYGPPGQRGLSPAFSEPNKNSAAAKGVKASPVPVGCIPFLGLFLHDLALNAELPTFLDPTSTNTPASVDSTGALVHIADPSAFDHLPPLPHHMPLRPLVNVHKFRVQATLVQRVLAFQEFAEGYPYEPETSVYFKCLKIRSLDSTAMREVSLRLAES